MGGNFARELDRVGGSALQDRSAIVLGLMLGMYGVLGSVGGCGIYLATECIASRGAMDKGTAVGGVAQTVRAPACHAGGRGFESRHSRQLPVATGILRGRGVKRRCYFFMSAASSLSCLSHRWFGESQSSREHHPEIAAEAHEECSNVAFVPPAS